MVSKTVTCGMENVTYVALHEAKCVILASVSKSIHHLSMFIYKLTSFVEAFLSKDECDRWRPVKLIMHFGFCGEVVCHGGGLAWFIFLSMTVRHRGTEPA